MVFIDQMKDLKIYKRALYLPTSGDNNKKTKSAILLLTPNKNSSVKLMKSPLTINRKRFTSYYIEKDLSYYITGKVGKGEDTFEESVLSLMEDSGEYIREDMSYVDITNHDKITDVFASYIRVSGYNDDILEVKDKISPYLYYSILSAMHFKPSDKTDIPILNIVVKHYVVEDDTNISFNVTNEADGYTYINITVCGTMNFIINSIADVVAHCIFAIVYPKVDNTFASSIFIAYIFDIDGEYNNIAQAIFKTDEDVDKYLDYCKSGDVKSIVNMMHSANLEYTINDIYICGQVEEAKTPITMTNITDKFKYMSTTKYKKKFSTFTNTFKRLTKRLNASFKVNVTPGSSNVANTQSASSVNTVSTASNVSESVNSNLIDELDESEYLKLDDNIVTFFDESSNKTYNSQLRKLLYNERIMKRKDLINLYNDIKLLNPDIMYTYIDLPLYKSKNIFIDLYFYNQLFFKNNLWNRKKGYNIYLELLDRLINDPKLKANGYSTKTIFIPVLDWSVSKDTRMWLYTESINPISIIFDLIKTDSGKMKSIFGDTNIVFFGNDSFFKINMNTIEPKKDLFIFKNFITKMIKNEEFEADDIDTSLDKESPKVIKTNIYDAIDVKSDIDLTGREKIGQAKLSYMSHNHTITRMGISSPKTLSPDKLIAPAVAATGNVVKTQFKGTTHTVTNTPKAVVIDTKVNKSFGSAKDPIDPMDVKMKSHEIIPKSDNAQAIRDKAVDTKKIQQQDDDLDRLAYDINNIAAIATDTDDALNQMDDIDDIKSAIIDLDSMRDDSVKIDDGRAARMNNLDKKFLQSDINGRTVKDILMSSDPNSTEATAPLPKTELKVASPNKEWKEMSYMNFDKHYDIERDIVNCFYHFTKVSKPYAIRNLSIENHTTSEDRLMLYKVECEDFRGKRFTIKLDIPIMKDNRFLLRGNDKCIQNQLFNMPIIKTDLDTCQVISNYQKVFIRRKNAATGRSYPTVARLLKAFSKYTGNKIKVTYGNNQKVCNKYELPIDYVDLATAISKIEYKNCNSNVTIFFNQDEIRNLYPDEIQDSMGIPYRINETGKDHSIMYFNITGEGETFADDIKDLLYYTDNEFADIIDGIQPPASGTFSMCSILNTEIPLIILCGYCEGITKVLNKAGITWEFQEKINKKELLKFNQEYIKLDDGYLVYRSSYTADLLLNGLSGSACDIHTMADLDNKQFYLEALDNYGGRIKADGIDNFYDCLVDPITEENLDTYKMPKTFIEIFLYANALLADNKFVKHTDTTSRRLRRYEQIAAYTYEALSEAYAAYSNAVKHNKGSAVFSIKQTAVIDKVMTSPIMSDDSVISALNDVETTNAITYKGKAGLNNARSYSIDKRTYDDSMLNVIGMSTGFSGNVGITRQGTMDLNLQGDRGYIKSIDGNTDKMNAARTLCATEALTPFGTTRDDGNRTDMTFIQTAKHMVRTETSDPLLVTNGADEALPYLTTNKFAYKAEEAGKVIELTDDYMIVEYLSGKKDYINLKPTIEKNSDGGFYIPMQITASEKLKVGSKFDATDILAYDKLSFSNSVGESDNIAYNIGTLAKVAIIDTDEGFEDSGLCTEGLSKKLATKVIQKEDRILGKDSIVYKIAKVGDEVKVNDPLLIWQDPKDSEEAETLAKMMDNDTDTINQLGRKVIKAPLTGTVVGIKMYRTVELSDLSASLKRIFTEYEKPIKELKAKLDEQKIDTSELPATYKLGTTGKLKKAEDAILVEFFVQYTDTVAIGDKITYFSANKAVVKSIVPQDLAPYTDFRPNEPIDAMVAQMSIDKRMVTSTLVYGSLQKLLVELDRSVKDMLDIKYDDSKA